MKIKTKKRLNLPQLIEWVEKNGIRNHVFISDIDRNEVEINIHGCIFCKYITLKDTFTVEVEEEITEDTVLPRILVKTNYDDTAKEYNNSMINEFVPKYIRAIYIINEDYTMTLIWRNGKLVE